MISIALLRGINVGGNQMVKMADLRAMFAELGFLDAKTLLQSGNVVFRAESHSATELEEMLEVATEKRFGFRPAYLVRSLDEWQKAIEGNPFVEEAEKDPSHLLVAYTKSPPDREEVARVQAAIQGPERIAVGMNHLYLVYPEGIGTSKVDRTPGWRKLLSQATARNWNTVLKMALLGESIH